MAEAIAAAPRPARYDDAVIRKFVVATIGHLDEAFEALPLHASDRPKQAPEICEKQSARDERPIGSEVVRHDQARSKHTNAERDMARDECA